MKYLLIDTATRFTHLALCKNGEILASTTNQGLNFQSEEALPLIISLLTENHLSLSDLKGVFIGIGPGSFTGTRVGVAIAKTIGFSLNIPCIPFCSHLCYAPLDEGDFMIITDAKNKKIYALQGCYKEGKLDYDKNPSLLSYDDIKQSLVNTQTNLLFIDPIPDAPQGSAWKVDLKVAAESAFTEWSLGNYRKAQEIKVLYLRGQKDL